jgi:hypothetical protein
MSRPRTGKRDIDQAKRERAARKRERRALTSDDVAEAPGHPDGASEQEVLRALADLQARFESEELTFEGYEARKAALLEQLQSG